VYAVHTTMRLHRWTVLDSIIDTVHDSVLGRDSCAALHVAAMQLCYSACAAKDCFALINVCGIGHACCCAQAEGPEGSEGGETGDEKLKYEQPGTLVTLPNGIKYREILEGGGKAAQIGDKCSSRCASAHVHGGLTRASPEQMCCRALACSCV
jgi:hypothetical protein